MTEGQMRIQIINAQQHFLISTQHSWYQVFIPTKQAGYQAVFESLPCLCQIHKTPCKWSPK